MTINWIEIWAKYETTKQKKLSANQQFEIQILVNEQIRNNNLRDKSYQIKQGGDFTKKLYSPIS